MREMDAYIPPPSLREIHPLSRGDHGQDNVDSVPIVPSSNFFLTTFPPSNSLTLFNQPTNSQLESNVHFHTPLQNTVFPSVSQSLPPFPLPPNFVRELLLYLGLPDGAAPVPRRP